MQFFSDAAPFFWRFYDILVGLAFLGVDLSWFFMTRLVFVLNYGAGAVYSLLSSGAMGVQSAIIYILPYAGDVGLSVFVLLRYLLEGLSYFCFAFGHILRDAAISVGDYLLSCAGGAGQMTVSFIRFLWEIQIGVMVLVLQTGLDWTRNAISFILPYIGDAGRALIGSLGSLWESSIGWFLRSTLDYVVGLFSASGRAFLDLSHSLLDSAVVFFSATLQTLAHGMNAVQLLILVLLVLLLVILSKKNLELTNALRLQNESIREIQRRLGGLNMCHDNDKKKVTDSSNSKVSAGLCCICLDKEINSVFFPCGHLLSCYDCGQNLHSCPYCLEGTNFVCRRAYFVGF